MFSSALYHEGLQDYLLKQIDGDDESSYVKWETFG